MQVPDRPWDLNLDTGYPGIRSYVLPKPSLLIRGTASDVAGIDSETVLRNTVSESRIVTSEKGNVDGWNNMENRGTGFRETKAYRREDGKRRS